MIEQWLDNETIATCHNASLGADNQKWHDERVLPYVDMTIKGWIWYQGENNCHGLMGNSASEVGYGCLMPRLVRRWRQLWSSEPDTTDPLAPFGVVTLAKGGSEGGHDIGGMRWSQTANYGVLPNPEMPNTFLAQAFDLGDPFENKACYDWNCCAKGYNATYCAERTQDNPAMCNAYCAVLDGTNFYMGPIHPRDKKPVGDRLAKAAKNVVYGGTAAYTGPTVSGCSASDDRIVVRFNTSLLRGDHVHVKSYNKSTVYSGFRVLVDDSKWCLQTEVHCRALPNGTIPCIDHWRAWDGCCPSRNLTWWCVDNGDGSVPSLPTSPVSDEHPDLRASVDGVPPTNPFETPEVWVNVDVVAGDDASTVVLDLGALGGQRPKAIRYAWQDTNGAAGCCYDLPTGVPCEAGSCPIFGSSGLPANPFVAHIVDGRCECVAPQTCKESTVDLIRYV